jgi:hypothetical protein
MHGNTMHEMHVTVVGPFHGSLKLSLALVPEAKVHTGMTILGPHSPTVYV